MACFYERLGAAYERNDAWASEVAKACNLVDGERIGDRHLYFLEQATRRCRAELQRDPGWLERGPAAVDIREPAEVAVGVEKAP